jgi:hypothetical protein
MTEIFVSWRSGEASRPTYSSEVMSMVRRVPRWAKRSGHSASLAKRSSSCAVGGLVVVGIVVSSASLRRRWTETDRRRGPRRGGGDHRRRHRRPESASLGRRRQVRSRPLRLAVRREAAPRAERVPPRCQFSRYVVGWMVAHRQSKHSTGEVRPTPKPAPLAQPCPPLVSSPRSRRLLIVSKHPSTRSVQRRYSGARP